MTVLATLTALAVADTFIPVGSTDLIAAILRQEGGPRRHESRSRLAIARVADAAIRLAGDARGIDYLTDYYAAARGWPEFGEKLRQWVRVEGEVGGHCGEPTGLVDGWLPVGQRPDYHLWQVAALLRLEADYAPSTVGGFESTARTAACAWAPRRMQGGGPAWTASILAAARSLEARQRMTTAGAVPASQIAGFYAVHLRQLLARWSTARAARAALDGATAALESARQRGAATADTPHGVDGVRFISMNLDAPAPPAVSEAEENELSDLEAARDRAVDSLAAAQAAASSAEAVEITAAACLQWLRRQAAAFATDRSDPALPAALDVLALAIMDVSAVRTGEEPRRLQRQVARIAEHVGAVG